MPADPAATPTTGTGSDGERFQDATQGLWDFTDGDVLVACPGCRAPALVRILARHETFLLHSSRELICGRCLLRRRTDASVLYRTGPRDPFFDEPLWLQTPCGGHVLWAFNEGHTAFLRDVVTARLREGVREPAAPRPYSDRLPRWVLDRMNRREVLAALDRLDALADEHRRGR